MHFGRLGLCVAHASRSFSHKPPARIDEIQSPCPSEDGGDATPRGSKAISGVALDDGDHRRFSERCSKGSPALLPGASSNSAMCACGARRREAAVSPRTPRGPGGLPALQEKTLVFCSSARCLRPCASRARGRSGSSCCPAVIVPGALGPARLLQPLVLTCFGLRPCRGRPRLPEKHRAGRSAGPGWRGWAARTAPPGGTGKDSVLRPRPA